MIHPLFICSELLFGSDCISRSTEKPSAALEETGEEGGVGLGEEEKGDGEGGVEVKGE